MAVFYLVGSNTENHEYRRQGDSGRKAVLVPKKLFEDQVPAFIEINPEQGAVFVPVPNGLTAKENKKLWEQQRRDDAKAARHAIFRPPPPPGQV